jgi:hypothetical protein
MDEKQAPAEAAGNGAGAGRKAAATRRASGGAKKPAKRLEGERDVAAFVRGGEERLSFSIGPAPEGKYKLTTRRRDNGAVPGLATNRPPVVETFATFAEAQARQAGLVSSAKEKGWTPQKADKSSEALLD